MRIPNPFGDKDKNNEQPPENAPRESQPLFGSEPAQPASSDAGATGNQEPFAPGSEEPAPIYGQSQGSEPIRWGSSPDPARASEEPTSVQPTTPEQPADPVANSPYFGSSSSTSDPVEPLSAQSANGDEDRLSRDVPLPDVASKYSDGGGSGQETPPESGPQHSSELESSESTWEQPAARTPEPSSRVSVVDEPSSRPAPPAGASEEEYKWHTYKVYPSGRPDAVEFIDTYKAFGRNRILRGLNMGLPEGMVSMILGPSGTGKSVCIKHMVGLLYPDQGDVLVHGHSVPNMPDDDLFEMRKKFGLLFQDGALFGSMNLYDNVAFPLRQHTEKGEDEIESVVMRRLNEVGLGHSRDKYPNELSGGMRKRAGFARALVLEPDIVLFDEPDSGLDPVRTALLGELILEIHRDMMEEAKAKQREHLPTFAVITHDIMSARRVADYINVLWKGRIVEAGPAEDMLNSENPFIRQFLAGESQGPLTMD
jgi:phospholipid/cholesterol/gamma-HCH transport system ATP-binding protein